MIDGADGLNSFWHITLPLIAPTLMFLFVVGTIQRCIDFQLSSTHHSKRLQKS